MLNDAQEDLNEFESDDMADLKWSDPSIEENASLFSYSLPQNYSINSDRLIDLRPLQRLDIPIYSNRSIQPMSPRRLGSSSLDRSVQLSYQQRLDTPIYSNRLIQPRSPRRLGSSSLDCHLWAGDFEEGNRGNNCVENPANGKAPPKTKTSMFKRTQIGPG